MERPEIIDTDELAKLELNENNFNKLKKQVESLQNYLHFKEPLTKELTSTEDILRLTKKKVNYGRKKNNRKLEIKISNDLPNPIPEYLE